MFFPSEGNNTILNSAVNTALSHILVVEPLYYAVHRWLHKPEQMKSMHGFHHSSINTCPSTSLVQGINYIKYLFSNTKYHFPPPPPVQTFKSILFILLPLDQLCYFLILLPERIIG
jgi:sterol desaturase/sphingolipid hydroxylase (fatty acid hydroxylase superfamily)